MELWNKIDLLSEDELQATLAEASRRDDVVSLSAVSGDGIGTLGEEISTRLRGSAAVHHVELPLSDGSKLAWLHSRGEVLDSRVDGDMMNVEVRLSPENWTRFQSL